MDEIYFLTRYIPFWGIPMFLIGGEFAYLYWVRKKKKRMMLGAFLSIFSLFSLVFYYWAGGPEKSVQYLVRIVRFYVD
jgi:hypothetical protein